MTNVSNLITSCLNEMSSGSYKLTHESLVVLLNHLEERRDPDPAEIEIVKAVYEFIEKYKLLENSLRTYTRNSEQLLGDKIQSLYDNNFTTIE